MAVSKRTRYEVLKRDGHTCRYCRSTENTLVIDHVIPTALGGSDDPANLVAACKDCNAGKAASNPDAELVAQVSDDAIRWATAMRRAVDGWLAAREDAFEYGQAVARAWDSGNDMYRWGRARLDDDWTETVDRWRGAGLPVELITEAVGIAMRRKAVSNWDVWRYACGIVWTKLTELQEAARQSLSGSDDATPSAADDEWQRGFDDAFRVPLLHVSYVQARALSRVVDGPQIWNRTAGAA